MGRADDDAGAAKPLLDHRESDLELTDTYPAFEVSKTKRIVQIAIAVVACLFAAGPVFGYAALKPVLIAEGVYRDKCSIDEIKEGARVCRSQDLSLNFMFTVAAVTTNVGALLVGTVLDSYGPRVAGLIGGVSSGLGTALFAFASRIHFDAYLLGYSLLALGGPFIFISSFHLSNAFPQRSGTILSLLTGAFDASSIVFFVYRVLYERSGQLLKPKTFFTLFLVIPAFIIITQIFFMPRLSYKTVPELVEVAEVTEQALEEMDDDMSDNTARQIIRERRESVISEVTELLGSKVSVEDVVKEEVKRETSGVWGAMHGKSAWEQIRSPWWILITAFTVIQMTRINYFVATIRSQYEFLLGSYSAAVQVNEFFDVALPLGGLASVPFVGILLDRASTARVLMTLVAFATLIGILGLIPNIAAGYLNVLLFVIYRPFYYTTVSDYSAKVFGFETFGKVYGSMICLSGLLNIGQTGLDYLTKFTFKKNPLPVNIFLLTVASVVGVVLVWFVDTRAKQREIDQKKARNGGALEAAGFA